MNVTTHALVKAPAAGALTIQDTVSLAEHFARSGYFKDAADVSKAVVKIVAGQELGIPAMAAMTGIHLIEGKPALSAGLVSALVLRSGRYSYHVVRSDDAGCEIEWFRDGQAIGRSAFTMEEAKRAGVGGKQNWQRYPSDMCFARAVTRGARRFCADVFLGAVYVPEELGGDVDPDTGEVIEVQVQRPTNGHAAPAPATPQVPAAPAAFEPASEPEPDWHATPHIEAMDTTEQGLDVLRQIVAHVPSGYHRVGAITKCLLAMAQLAESYEDLDVVSGAYEKARHALTPAQQGEVGSAIDVARIVIEEALAEEQVQGEAEAAAEIEAQARAEAVLA